MKLFQPNTFSRMKFYTACFTVLSFTLTNLVLPSTLQAAPEVSSKSVNIQDFSGLKIPESLAKVETLFEGDEKAGRSVVVIQDAHAIPDAQRSIRKTILFLEKEYGAKLIGVEGASGDLDTRIFESYPDQEGLQKVFKDYMDKGEMTGSVAAAIFGLKKEMSSRGAEFFGVEDWPVYEEGLALYLAAMGEEEKILKEIEAGRLKVEEEKKIAYSPELLKVDQAQIAFEENSNDLLVYLKTLAAVQTPAAGSEIALLLNEADKGQTEDAALDAEVRRLAGKLKGHLGKLSPQGQKVFSEKYQAFQTSQLSAAQFALALKDLSVKEGFKLPMSQAMAHQAFNQRRMRDLEGTQLFKDIEAYTAAVKESLFRNDIERQLDQRTHDILLLTKWAKLELSREDWAEVKQRLESNTQIQEKTDGVSASGGNVSAGDFSGYSDLFKFNKAFYENAEKRDAAFIQNLEKRLKPGQTAVMVAGGFHAQGLAEHLKAKGIDYALVMPAIEKLPEQSAYREQMKGNVDWKNYYEVKDGKINLYEAFVRYTRDRLLGKTKEEKAADPQILKNWRDEIIRDLADEGKITKAGEYTRFIDETVQNKEMEARMQNVEKFITGLEDLAAKGQFKAPNIGKLLRAAQSASVASNQAATVLAGNAHGIVSKIPLNVTSRVLNGAVIAPTLSPEVLPVVAASEVRGAVDTGKDWLSLIQATAITIKTRWSESDSNVSFVREGRTFIARGEDAQRVIEQDFNIDVLSTLLGSAAKDARSLAIVMEEAAVSLNRAVIKFDFQRSSFDQARLVEVIKVLGLVAEYLRDPANSAKESAARAAVIALTGFSSFQEMADAEVRKRTRAFFGSAANSVDLTDFTKGFDLSRFAAFESQRAARVTAADFGTQFAQNQVVSANFRRFQRPDFGLFGRLVVDNTNNALDKLLKALRADFSTRAADPASTSIKITTAEIIAWLQRHPELLVGLPADAGNVLKTIITYRDATALAFQRTGKDADGLRPFRNDVSDATLRQARNALAAVAAIFSEMSQLRGSDGRGINFGEDSTGLLNRALAYIAKIDARLPTDDSIQFGVLEDVARSEVRSAPFMGFHFAEEASRLSGKPEYRTVINDSKVIVRSQPIPTTIRSSAFPRGILDREFNIWLEAKSPDGRDLFGTNGASNVQALRVIPNGLVLTHYDSRRERAVRNILTADKKISEVSNDVLYQEARRAVEIFRALQQEGDPDIQVIEDHFRNAGPGSFDTVLYQGSPILRLDIAEYLARVTISRVYFDGDQLLFVGSDTENPVIFAAPAAKSEVRMSAQLAVEAAKEALNKLKDVDGSLEDPTALFNVTGPGGISQKPKLATRILSFRAMDFQVVDDVDFLVSDIQATAEQLSGFAVRLGGELEVKRFPGVVANFNDVASELSVIARSLESIVQAKKALKTLKDVDGGVEDPTALFNVTGPSGTSQKPKLATRILSFRETEFQVVNDIEFLVSDIRATAEQLEGFAVRLAGGLEVKRFPDVVASFNEVAAQLSSIATTLEKSGLESRSEVRLTVAEAQARLTDIINGLPDEMKFPASAADSVYRESLPEIPLSAEIKASWLETLQNTTELVRLYRFSFSVWGSVYSAVDGNTLIKNLGETVLSERLSGYQQYRAALDQLTNIVADLSASVRELESNPKLAEGSPYTSAFLKNLDYASALLRPDDAVGSLSQYDLRSLILPLIGGVTASDVETPSYPTGIRSYYTGTPSLTSRSLTLETVQTRLTAIIESLPDVMAFPAVGGNVLLSAKPVKVELAELKVEWLQTVREAADLKDIQYFPATVVTLLETSISGDPQLFRTSEANLAKLSGYEAYQTAKRDLLRLGIEVNRTVLYANLFPQRYLGDVDIKNSVFSLYYPVVTFETTERLLAEAQQTLQDALTAVGASSYERPVSPYISSLRAIGSDIAPIYYPRGGKVSFWQNPLLWLQQAFWAAVGAVQAAIFKSKTPEPTKSIFEAIPFTTTLSLPSVLQSSPEELDFKRRSSNVKSAIEQLIADIRATGFGPTINVFGTSGEAPRSYTNTVVLPLTGILLSLEPIDNDVLIRDGTIQDANRRLNEVIQRALGILEGDELAPPVATQLGSKLTAAKIALRANIKRSEVRNTEQVVINFNGQKFDVEIETERPLSNRLFILSGVTTYSLDALLTRIAAQQGLVTLRMNEAVLQLDPAASGNDANRSALETFLRSNAQPQTHNFWERLGDSVSRTADQRGAVQPTAHVFWERLGDLVSRTGDQSGAAKPTTHEFFEALGESRLGTTLTRALLGFSELLISPFVMTAAFFESRTHAGILLSYIVRAPLRILAGIQIRLGLSGSEGPQRPGEDRRSEVRAGGLFTGIPSFRRMARDSWGFSITAAVFTVAYLGLGVYQGRQDAEVRKGLGAAATFVAIGQDAEKTDFSIRSSRGEITDWTELEANLPPAEVQLLKDLIEFHQDIRTSKISTDQASVHEKQRQLSAGLRQAAKDIKQSNPAMSKEMERLAYEVLSLWFKYGPAADAAEEAAGFLIKKAAAVNRSEVRNTERMVINFNGRKFDVEIETERPLSNRPFLLSSVTTTTLDALLPKLEAQQGAVTIRLNDATLQLNSLISGSESLRSDLETFLRSNAQPETHNFWERFGTGVYARFFQVVIILALGALAVAALFFTPTSAPIIETRTATFKEFKAVAIPDQIASDQRGVYIESTVTTTPIDTQKATFKELKPEFIPAQPAADGPRAVIFSSFETRVKIQTAANLTVNVLIKNVGDVDQVSFEIEALTPEAIAEFNTILRASAEKAIRQIQAKQAEAQTKDVYTPERALAEIKMLDEFFAEPIKTHKKKLAGLLFNAPGKEKILTEAIKSGSLQDLLAVVFLPSGVNGAEVELPGDVTESPVGSIMRFRGGAVDNVLPVIGQNPNPLFFGVEAKEAGAMASPYEEVVRLYVMMMFSILSSEQLENAEELKLPTGNEKIRGALRAMFKASEVDLETLDQLYKLELSQGTTKLVLDVKAMLGRITEDMKARSEVRKSA